MQRCSHAYASTWTFARSQKASVIFPSPFAGEGQVENPAKGGGEGELSSRPYGRGQGPKKWKISTVKQLDFGKW